MNEYYVETEHMWSTPKGDRSARMYDGKEVDAKFKEYDDDNLALSQSVVKLGARIGSLESLLQQALHVFDTMNVDGLSEQWKDEFKAKARSLMER
jgi:hypothetical protein